MTQASTEDITNIKRFLQSIHPLEEPVLSEYLSHCVPYELPRKSIMIAEGETERHLYFVLEGIQKSYYMGGRKMHVIAFAYAPSFSGIPESFFAQQPSRYYLETVTYSRFLRISYTTHQQLLEAHRPIETLYRKTLEGFLYGVIQRQHELLAYTMEERFRVFVNRSAHLLNMVPHKDLASYLRIDPTNFSKLLGKNRI
jgi:CRP-like cAMP-binding protein